MGERSSTTVRPGTQYRGTLVCDHCGAIFTPQVFTLAFDLTLMGGGITPPITRQAEQCPGCGRWWAEAPVANTAEGDSHG